VKPSRDQRISSVDASHLTTDDLTEPDCSLATTSNVLPVSCETCAPTLACNVVGSGNTGEWKSDPVAVLRRHGTAERGLRARSYPPAGKMPVAVDDWFGLAPLASPETLSESSSLASCGSSGAVAGLGYQRVMSSVLPPRMDPILQSPARSSNSRDCCLHLESADVVGDLATLSPCVENLPSPLAPRHHGPDIVPMPHFVIAGPSSGSSPDVIHETRLLANTSALNGNDTASDTCQNAADLWVQCRHHENHDMVTDTSHTCERGACACGNVRPDIVCTHDCRGPAVHDVVSVDE